MTIRRNFRVSRKTWHSSILPSIEWQQFKDKFEAFSYCVSQMIDDDFAGIKSEIKLYRYYAPKPLYTFKSEDLSTTIHNTR